MAFLACKVYHMGPCLQNRDCTLASLIGNSIALQVNNQEFGVFVDVGTRRHGLLHQSQFQVRLPACLMLAQTKPFGSATSLTVLASI